MAAQITNYQCPACTGPLQYSAGTGKLECEYCGNSFDIDQIKELYADQEERAAAAMAAAETEKSTWDDSDLTDEWGNEAEGMKAYSCPSCGAQLICDETTAATACPYCGNPAIVPGQFTGSLRPDFVLPFRLKKEDAIAQLKAHFKGKLFLPGTFLADHTLEKIQGVYVPFWLYDGTVSGDYLYKTTHVAVHRRGDYEITTTDHFLARRAGSMSFEKVPVDASSKMPDDYMDSIEPFDYSELTPFSTAYLPGFLADKYDVGMEVSNRRADSRCIHTLEDAIESTLIGYTTRIPVENNIVSINRGKIHYALLPVWLLNVRWEDKTYLFAVNGQTGRTAGNLPASKSKALAFFAGLAVPLSILGTLLAFFITG